MKPAKILTNDDQKYKKKSFEFSEFFPQFVNSRKKANLKQHQLYGKPPMKLLVIKIMLTRKTSEIDD